MFWLRTVCLLSGHRAHIHYGRQRQKPRRDPLFCAALAALPVLQRRTARLPSTSLPVSLRRILFSIQSPSGGARLRSFCIRRCQTPPLSFFASRIVLRVPEIKTLPNLKRCHWGEQGWEKEAARYQLLHLRGTDSSQSHWLVSNHRGLLNYTILILQDNPVFSVSWKQRLARTSSTDQESSCYPVCR